MIEWKPWAPKENINNLMIAKSSFISDKGLILGFEDKAHTKNVFIEFKKGFLSVRESDEFCYEKSFESLSSYLHQIGHSKKEHGYLFILEKSDYIDWFIKQSLRTYDQKEIKHYVIITDDVISEILSTEAPEIVIKRIT
jgi:hypothetical protein